MSHQVEIAKLKEVVAYLESLDAPTAEKFTISIHKTPTYDELCKQFDWVNGNYKTAVFKDNFVSSSGEVELVHFDQDISYKNALAKLSDRGLRPATYEELLAFARQYPDEQRQFPILALGSVAVLDDHEHVACLYGDGAGRVLNLSWVEGEWDDVCRFLAVRK